MYSEKVSILVLDFARPNEGKILLESLKKLANFNKEIVYLCNGDIGDNNQYAYDFYKQGLIDTLIIKKNGDGGGFGQTDLIRYCKTKYCFFIQVDQVLIQEITQNNIDYFINLLNNGYKCVDLNGDQSNRRVWTDRAHFIDSGFFNSLGEFPNFGPGLDNGKWNEQHLQEKFIENNYKIAHIQPLFFGDMGKWSLRSAGDGLYKHRCDEKTLWILKTPSYKTEVYPPLDDKDWELALSGNWPINGKVPNLWRGESFTVKYWADKLNY